MPSDKPETTPLEWLEGQIAFKPNHPYWDVIMKAIDQLKAAEEMAKALEPLCDDYYLGIALGDQKRCKDACVSWREACGK